MPPNSPPQLSDWFITCRTILRGLLRSAVPALVILLLAIAAPAQAPAHAQADGLLITGEAGLDGFCKEGAWMPVRVVVENDGDDIDGVLYASTSDTRSEWRFSVEASFPSVSRKEWTIYVFPIDRETTIELAVVSGNRTLVETTLPVTCVGPAGTLMGVWAENPSIFNTQTTIQTAGSRPSLVRLGAADIPDRLQGLEMLDTLTVSDVDTGGLTDAQRAVLAGWVAGGGRLIVAGGPGWQKTAAGLGVLLPLTPSGSETLSGLDEIAAYVQSSDALAGPVVAATGAILPGATVLVSQGGIPLVVSRQHGFGEVIYLAVDPAFEPLRTWFGMADLYADLIGRAPDLPAWRDGFNSWFEADTALNAIPGLGMPSAWLICGFILLYGFVVGPLNFALLRVLKKRELAWVSVPAIAIFFSGLIFIVGTTVIGSRAILNRLSIVQVWPGEGQARVDGLLGIFSPGQEVFELELGAGFSGHPVPASGFVGDSEVSSIIQTDAGLRFPEIRVDTGGMEGYAVAGLVIAPEFRHDLKIAWLPGGTRQLSGDVVNASSLTLEDAVILSPGPAIHLGDFQPGDSANVQVFLGGSSGALPQGGGPLAPAGGFGSPDDTLIELFGTNYMYASPSWGIDDFRRFNLLSAALGGTVGGRGGGVYLLGWTDQAPFDTDLPGQSERNTDTTLYIIHLQPAAGPIESDADLLTLPPNLFLWSVIGESTGSTEPGPYESHVRSGSFALSFIPIERFAFSVVAELTLHLESYGATGNINFDVALWDFTENAWITLEDVRWGSTPIPSPARYVGPDGEIRVALSASGTNRHDIERADFTLAVIP
ncbi:MAG TPA: hypothetical protein VMN57_06175 [Anaerolineales bacterium]|nr:hypothetical protein [Anaerolineales bacterium]